MSLTPFKRALLVLLFAGAGACIPPDLEYSCEEVKGNCDFPDYPGPPELSSAYWQISNERLGLKTKFYSLKEADELRFTWYRDGEQLDLSGDATSVAAPDFRSASWRVEIVAASDYGQSERSLTLDIPNAAHPLTIDTGQVECFDSAEPLASCPKPGAPFSGQDGNYREEITAGAFVPLEGAVLDRRTGLLWLDPAQDAVTCDTYEALGHSDWRLPQRLDWLTLLNFGLPGLPMAFTDRRTELRTADGNIDLEDGLPTYARDVPLRCVRGGVDVEATDEIAFTASDTVTHFSTGLVWTSFGTPAPYKWEEALAYCQELTLGGNATWRLPNLFELASIVPHLDHISFVRTADDIQVPVYFSPEFIWTSTTVRNVSHWAYGFTGYQREILGYTKSEPGYVLCVRDAD